MQSSTLTCPPQTWDLAELAPLACSPPHTVGAVVLVAVLVGFGVFVKMKAKKPPASAPPVALIAVSLITGKEKDLEGATMEEARAEGARAEKAKAERLSRARQHARRQAKSEAVPEGVREALPETESERREAHDFGSRGALAHAAEVVKSEQLLRVRLSHARLRLAQAQASSELGGERERREAAARARLERVVKARAGSAAVKARLEAATVRFALDSAAAAVAAQEQKEAEDASANVWAQVGRRCTGTASQRTEAEAQAASERTVKGAHLRRAQARLQEAQERLGQAELELALCKADERAIHLIAPPHSPKLQRPAEVPASGLDSEGEDISSSRPQSDGRACVANGPPSLPPPDDDDDARVQALQWLSEQSGRSSPSGRTSPLLRA